MRHSQLLDNELLYDRCACLQGRAIHCCSGQTRTYFSQTLDRMCMSPSEADSEAVAQSEDRSPATNMHMTDTDNARLLPAERANVC